ncbi:DUF1801 domain-containing protein [Chitinophaga sp.]|uniref:DUF1801 domain-containing protein n=1 Tax=Chitinophaga sp. TaxID=1869181 RepID=UPI0031CFD0E6
MNDTEKVNELMQRLEHPLKAEIEAVRAIILKAGGEELAERVKWNAPSFYPKKDRKKDMAAFHTRATQHVHLVFVFHNGAMIHDSSLLEGDYKDRRMAYFKDMADVKAKKKELERVVKEWVKRHE